MATSENLRGAIVAWAFVAKSQTSPLVFASDEKTDMAASDLWPGKVVAEVAPVGGKTEIRS
ncbi:hypothetical protein [Paenibacillus sp. UNC496MF]|uniref:hypothetical protein n=1 Tax=Paenibacillus sp. UNC496MF TaxID=1502753 RepID=UPI0011604ADE|nr:hypothetical protein [Paenibacillus sp. UNC496MF]